MADESLHRTGRTPEIIPLSEEIERIVLEKPELWNYNLLEAETGLSLREEYSLRALFLSIQLFTI